MAILDGLGRIFGRGPSVGDDRSRRLDRRVERGAPWLLIGPQWLAAHYAERGLAGRNWTGGLIRRLETPIRKELLAYYRSKGAHFD